MLLVFFVASSSWAGLSTGVRISGPRGIGNFSSSVSKFSNQSSGLGNLSSRPGTPGAGPLSSPLSRGNALRSNMTYRKGRGMQVQNNQRSHLGGIRTPNYTLSRRSTTKKNPYTVTQTKGFGRRDSLKSIPAPNLSISNKNPALRSGKSKGFSISATRPLFDAPDAPKSKGVFDISKGPRSAAPETSNFDTNIYSMLSPAQQHAITLNKDAIKEIVGEGGKEITTLVAESSNVADYLRKGEAALQNRDYRAAFFQYEQARTLSDSAPESTLSLVHAYLVASRTNYSMASFYLQKTLTILPQLPQLNVPVRSFLNSSDYATMVLRLRAHTEKHPRDTDARLCLAYVLLRDAPEKKDAYLKELRIAFQYAKELSETEEAVQIFWDALAKVGVSSEELTPLPLGDDTPKQIPGGTIEITKPTGVEPSK